MAVIGIYEKALPKGSDWSDKLTLAEELGFDFIEMSIDESDERISRLDWSKDEKDNFLKCVGNSNIEVPSICLSAHRRFPMGSSTTVIREKGLEVMRKAIDLAVDLGIRTIQLAGYDVFYEPKSIETREFFIENLGKAVKYASQKQVMLSIEIMDDTFMNSMDEFIKIKEQISSPWLQVYPDIGNLSAWNGLDTSYQIEKSIENITAVHIKDTINVSEVFEGKFKNVPWGEGDVNFLGILKTFKRLEYDGAFVIEMWSEDSVNPKKEIQEAINFINPILEEVGYEKIESN